MVTVRMTSLRSKAIGPMGIRLDDCLSLKARRKGWHSRTTSRRARMGRSLDNRCQAEAISMATVMATLSSQIPAMRIRQPAIQPSKFSTALLMEFQQPRTRASNVWLQDSCLEQSWKLLMTSTTMEWMNCWFRNSLLLGHQCSAVRFTCSWGTALKISLKVLIGQAKEKAMNVLDGCLRQQVT